MCVACVRALPSVDAATLSLRTGERAHEMLGASDAWAAGLEESQYMLGEGPAVEAFTAGRAVIASNLADNGDGGRWPMFTSAAVVARVGAVMVFPLQVGAVRLGTLDLYSRTSGAWPPAQWADGAALTESITYALLDRVDDDHGGRGRLAPAVSYQEVNIATGMVAAQLAIDLHEAFVRLRAHAYAQGLPLHEVARAVMERRLPLDRLES